MTTNKKTFSDTCDRFVAFLDIMGFKDLVFRNTHSDVLAKLMSFQPAVAAINEAAEEAFHETSNDHNKLGVIKAITFSDSLILVTNGESKKAAQNIISASKWIMQQAIKTGIPMKGAIAYGEQTDNFKINIHFGKPIIDAFELQEELHFYGVVLHYTREKYLNDLNLLESEKEEGIIFNWATPLKAGKVNHYVLNWPSIAHKKTITENNILNLYSNVSGYTRKYIDNTLDFMAQVKVVDKEVMDKQNNLKTEN